MARTLAVLLCVALLASGLGIFATPSARAADVSVTLIAKNIAWHVGTETSTQTTITVTAGDTLRLRIENHDTVLHTFTAPQFPAAPNQGGGGNTLNVTLDADQIFFWNFTLRSTDVGSWQYYCIPHSGGTYPNRSGMIGLIVVQSSTLPPSDNTALIVGGVLVLVIIVAAAALMLRKRPKPPEQPPAQPPMQP